MAGDTLDRAKDWVSLFKPGSDLMATCLAEREPAEGARADPGIDSGSHAKTAKLTSWAWAEGMDLALSRATEETVLCGKAPQHDLEVPRFPMTARAWVSVTHTHS